MTPEDNALLARLDNNTDKVKKYTDGGFYIFVDPDYDDERNLMPLFHKFIVNISYSADYDPLVGYEEWKQLIQSTLLAIAKEEFS